MTNRGPALDSLTSVWPMLWVETIADYAIFALSPDGRILSWNAGGERIYGYTREQALQHMLGDLYPEQDRRAGAPAAALRTAARGGRYESEGWRMRRDGTTFWGSVVMTPLHGAHGQLLGFGKIVRDMSDKKKVHDVAMESERRFRLLVQGVTDYAIFMLSPQGIVTNWNQGARRIKGYRAEEIIGSHFSRFYTPQEAAAGVPQRGLDVAAREGRWESEGWRVRRDGSRFWAHVVLDAIRDDDGELIGFAKITRDITERREAAQALEETRTALFQSQKMEAIGKLTGGVAHDFNNVLQVLRGNLELLENRHGGDAWSRERLAKAIDAVNRGAKLAAQLLALARQQPLKPRVVNLSGVLHGMDDLLRRVLGETIHIETTVADGLWNTLVDSHQLENVILNLAINARDAMPEGGRLVLALTNAALGPQPVAGIPDLRPGEYVMLAVTDTGTGMPPSVIERAFDPFFTTKPEGQGTGLGLSMAYGFVKQSGGHILIRSEPGRGTTVRIYLPRSTAPADTVLAPPSVAPQGGNETILVVEDDQAVQATVAETLAGLGYRVLRADDADQALALIRSGVHVDVLLSDVVMPGSIRSPELARVALHLRPRLKIVFTSGYTKDAMEDNAQLEDSVELLRKPYSREQLAARLRAVLGGHDVSIATGRARSPAPASGDAAAAPRCALQSAERVDQPSQGAASARQSTAPDDPAARAERLRILLVDDDAAATEAVREILSMQGHVTIAAGTAEDALVAIRRDRFDVLLTDITLPGMSGIELAQRSLDVQRSLRVIFASGNDVPCDCNLSFAWEVLRKPYTAEQLRAVLGRL
ncbi:PAS domain S-box protein [Mycetohabitans sp. B5]|uniref:histidine kinase n=1 Tax=Mycetohabitans endofungorum TaxID=417203 RepID=A0A2P5K6S2_9BURK|nr:MULTISPECIES: PAS domain S-box protein [Mycetohabitans]MCG1055985.1 PAS domain S-box protein [Mycetohabitans sp. B5]PPB81034.1 PAS domain S-box-containing protein [Mycetohabitans endofungorum]